MVVALDCARDLRVQHHAVGNDDDGIELRVSTVPQFCQLVCKPRNRVALAASRRVLNQVTLADAVGPHAAKQGAHGLQLMKAREHLFEPFYTTRAEGNGLGLAVSRELVAGMGGTLEYRDGDPGAIFSVHLPQGGRPS